MPTSCRIFSHCRPVFTARIQSMFYAISNLDIKTVNFSNVNVKQASEKVFSKLKSLRVLDFTNNPQARDKDKFYTG